MHIYETAPYPIWTLIHYYDVTSSQRTSLFFGQMDKVTLAFRVGIRINNFQHGADQQRKLVMFGNKMPINDKLFAILASGYKHE